MGILDKLNPLKWKEKLLEYRRVLDITRKPDDREFFKVSKITASGIGIIGAVGFGVFILYQFVLGGVV